MQSRGSGVAVILIPISFELTYLGVYSNATGSREIMAFAQHLLPNWFYGLFIAALLSAVMSSADTTLLTSSLILSELFIPTWKKKSIPADPDTDCCFRNTEHWHRPVCDFHFAVVAAGAHLFSGCICGAHAGRTAEIEGGKIPAHCRHLAWWVRGTGW